MARSWRSNAATDWRTRRSTRHGYCENTWSSLESMDSIRLRARNGHRKFDEHEQLVFYSSKKLTNIGAIATRETDDVKKECAMTEPLTTDAGRARIGQGRVREVSMTSRSPSPKSGSMASWPANSGTSATGTPAGGRRRWRLAGFRGETVGWRNSSGSQCRSLASASVSR